MAIGFLAIALPSVSSPAEASVRPVLRSLGVLAAAAGDRLTAGLAQGSSLQRERELAEARRLGRWETEEDRRLVREQEARVVLNKAGRAGSVGLVVVAWCVPPLWPVALVGSLRLFPRTTRRVLLSLVATGALGVVGLVLLVGVVSRPTLPPAAPEALPSLDAGRPALPSAAIEGLRP